MIAPETRVIEQPYHEGELAVQERAGQRDLALRHATIVTSCVAPRALPFLAAQRLVAVSAADAGGRVWVSVWCGEPGFVQSADGARVGIRRSAREASPDDPVMRSLVVGADLGILAIDLSSRRRLRINGTIDDLSAGGIGIAVRESIPNCPKYIQRRRAAVAPGASHAGGSTARGRVVDEQRQALLARADTAFVGSVHPSRGADASHRGGAPGFIRVVDATTLRIPDYPGNGMFLTLGNFESDPRASLAALDFEGGRMVSFSGVARLRFGADDPGHPTGGTGRYWELTIREWVEFDLVSPVRWELLDFSPFNPPAVAK